MRTSSAVRVYAHLLMATVFVLLAAPAHAQYKPRPLSDPATGEVYHIEGFAGFWFPDAAIEGSSSNLTVAPGTKIDFKKDLGLQNHAIGDLRVALRPIKMGQAPVRVHPDQLRAEHRSDERDHLQRSEIHGQSAGEQFA